MAPQLALPLANPIHEAARTIDVPDCPVSIQPGEESWILQPSGSTNSAAAGSPDHPDRARFRGLSPGRQIQVQAAALKAAANGIVITDRAGTIQWVNDAFTRMTGYAFEEAVGKTPRILKSGQHDADYYRRMWDAITSGRVWHGEVYNRRCDDTVYCEEMTITPVRDDADQISHFIAIKQDITERKQAEKQLARTQRLESLGTLAGGIAHDLNNCLAPILMSVELLKLEYPDAHRVLETVETSARRGAEMVRQLLTFAKGAEGERLLVQPRHLLKEMAKIVRCTFPKNIVVQCHYSPELPPVLGDATQLHQVLLNLAVNARDAMPEGGTIFLEAATREIDETYALTVPDAVPGRYVVLTVRDTGQGIAPEIMDRIFEPFFTTKGPEEGTGLGLSTVMGIVKGHRGFVRVSSALGQGSSFSVFLPAEKTQTGTTEIVRRAEPQVRGEGELILVVDDEVPVRAVTRSVLERLNFKVLTAADGADGLFQAAENRHDIRVVITDLQMPHMDGMALARALRRMMPNTRVIVAYGRLELEQASELKELGITNLLEKPFTERRLKQALSEALGGCPEKADASLPGGAL